MSNIEAPEKNFRCILLGEYVDEMRENGVSRHTLHMAKHLMITGTPSKMTISIEPGYDDFLDSDVIAEIASYVADKLKRPIGIVNL